MSGQSLEDVLEELRRQHAKVVNELESLRQFVDTSQVALKLAIFDRLPMPIWACDRDCRIVFWNTGAARLYGYSAEEAIGQDFVELFVNEPEREKARCDCIEIIDNDRPIKNMADDIDKHGNTRKLVTQCFAAYNVEDHPGLQVEISYEVQDIDRLQSELMRIQEAYLRAQEEREELRHKLVEVTRSRAIDALASVVESVKDSLRDRRKAVDQAALLRDADEKMITKARNEIKNDRERLLRWEAETRKMLMSHTSVEDLEELILSIERSDSFDV